MVFNDVENISNLLSGHRVIIYYITDDTSNRLRHSVESVMKLLEKKNDDLIIFNVRQETHQFTQFSEIYRPVIKAPISLFVVNAEGIPLICEDIYNEDNICQAFDSICSYCKLNTVSKNDISKVIDFVIKKDCEPGCFYDETNTNVKNEKEHASQALKKISSCESELSVAESSPNIITKHNNCVGSSLTELQIRLPDGTRDYQSFEKYACLQEVYNFVKTKYNIKDFNLKTYNHTVFSAEDYEETLQVLDLTPTGVVIVVFKNVVPFNNNGISKMVNYAIWKLFSKITPILTYLRGFLYASWNSVFPSGRPNNSSTGKQNQAGGSNSSSNKSATTGIKRSNFGNIHTLRRSDDSDDENNRYNGNSTQQK